MGSEMCIRDSYTARCLSLARFSKAGDTLPRLSRPDSYQGTPGLPTIALWRRRAGNRSFSSSDNSYRYRPEHLTGGIAGCRQGENNSTATRDCGFFCSYEPQAIRHSGPSFLLCVCECVCFIAPGFAQFQEVALSGQQTQNTIFP